MINFTFFILYLVLTYYFFSFLFSKLIRTPGFYAIALLMMLALYWQHQLEKRKDNRQG